MTQWIVANDTFLEGAMRINARLDDEHSDKIKYLTSIDNASISSVLKDAIDLYYEHARSAQASAQQVLSESGFIGVADVDEDLSVNYKCDLGEGLAAKYRGA